MTRTATARRAAASGRNVVVSTVKRVLLTLVLIAIVAAVVASGVTIAILQAVTN